MSSCCSLFCTGPLGCSSAKASCDLPPEVLTVEEVETVEIHEDIPAASVCEEAVAAEDVIEEANDDGTGALSERRNLSLEALFQVTDSELQNMSRETHIISGPGQLGGEVIVLGQLKSIVAPEKKLQAVVADNNTVTLAESLTTDSQCQVENMKLVCSQSVSEGCGENEEMMYQIISSSAPNTPTVINVTGVFGAGAETEAPPEARPPHLSVLWSWMCEAECAAETPASPHRRETVPVCSVQLFLQDEEQSVQTLQVEIPRHQGWGEGR